MGTSGEGTGGFSAGRRMGMAALMLSTGILLSRLLGYLREAVIAYQQGAGLQTDAYNAAFLLPDLMNYFLAGGTLSITFIPMFGACLAQEREADGWRLFSVIATTMGGVLLSGILVAELFTESFVGLLFPGFSGESVTLTTSMTRIVLPAQLFHYLGGLVLATLMAHGRFAAATLAPLVYNLCIIVFGLLLGPSMGMAGFAVGALIGAVAGPFGLSLWLARDIVRFRPSLAWREPGFRQYILLSIPLMLGVSLVTVDEWIGRVLGSSMQTGTISWLNYARRLMLVPIAVIGQAAGQAALPFLSRLAGAGKRDELAALLMRALHYVLLLALVAGALMFALAEPTVALVYERGAFHAADTARTAAVLRLFAVGIAAWGVQMVAARAFYAEQNTWIPMVLSTVVTGLSLPAYVVLGRLFGAEGLAGAATLGMTAQAVVTVWAYRRRNAALVPGTVLRSAGQGLLLAAVAGGLAWLVAVAMTSLVAGLLGSSWRALVVLGVAGPAGLAGAGLLARRLVPQDYERFVGRLASRLRRRRISA